MIITENRSPFYTSGSRTDGYENGNGEVMNNRISRCSQRYVGCWFYTSSGITVIDYDCGCGSGSGKVDGTGK